jgi:hypothetical protein
MIFVALVRELLLFISIKHANEAVVQKSYKKEDNRSNICIKDKVYVVANICQNGPRE